jgi:hypothetical protein
MNNYYLQYYQALEIQPGCSFKDLRYAYRRLVKEWHPDHFAEAHENRDPEYVERKIKDINQSFRSLSDYYKKNGCLPFSPEEAADLNKGGASLWLDNKQSRGRQPSQDKKASTFSISLRLMIAGAILGIGYVTWKTLTQEQNAPLNLATPAKSVPKKQSQLGSRQSRETEENFTIGSTVGEVIAAQGAPTSTEGDVWHYGQSKVYIEKGAVTKWENNSDFPLKVYIMPTSRNQPVKQFTIGSSKQEVRALQGSPLMEEENLWTYRMSRIYFKDQKVSGWYDSPLDPLKIQK